MSVPTKSYTVSVTIRMEMWLHEPVVYNADGWINPDFAVTVLRSLEDDLMHKLVYPSDIIHLDVKEIEYA